MSKYHPINEQIRLAVPEDRVEQRLHLLAAFVDELLIGLEASDDVFLNMTILTALVRSYFVDVERYKHFHDLDYIESYKIASYSTKWILRSKPIQFKVEDPNKILDPSMFVLNEFFALQWSFAVADIDISSISDDQFAELIYTFQYRLVAEDTLTLMFKALGGSDIPYDG